MEEGGSRCEHGIITPNSGSLGRGGGAPIQGVILGLSCSRGLLQVLEGGGTSHGPQALLEDG